jgi:hypothetical protein
MLKNIFEILTKPFKPFLIYRDNPNIPYLKRYFILPNNRYFNIYLHKFYLSDYEDELHDHPWANMSILLSGYYYEHIPKDYDKWIINESREEQTLLRKPFRPIFRPAKYIHRIELLNDSNGNPKPIWTLFITGPHIRQWGFWCSQGFVHNKKYLKVGPNGESSKGKGCD